MPHAKITSKGQITIPAEVRQALGLQQGDMLAFEVQAGYASVRRLPSASEVAAKFDEQAPIDARSDLTDDEGVAEYFAEEWDAGWGQTLYVAEGKGKKR